MKRIFTLLSVAALLSGCAAFTDSLARSPGKPSGDKITSDITMSRAFPKSAESRP